MGIREDVPLMPFNTVYHYQAVGGRLYHLVVVP